MIRINQFRFIIFFLLLFSMIITSPGCSSKKKNKSDKTSSQKTSNNKDNSNKDTKKEKDKAPVVIESVYEKSTILVTFNATNSLFEDFSEYNMELFDITLNITPEGATESSPYLLYGESPLADTEFLNTIPLNLTALKNDQYLLLDTFEVPPGTINSITLSLSGSTSKISVPSKNTYLIDSFFFNYQASDDRTSNNKLLPAQVTLNTDFSLSKDGFHVINFTIDKNMTAGLDPWYYEADTDKGLPKQHYLQFIPAISAQKLSSLTDANIMMSGVTMEGNMINMGDLLIPHTSNGAEMTMDGTTINESPVLNDETRVNLEGNLSTVGSPSLTITKINLFSDHEKLSTYTENTYTEQKSLWVKPDETWLVFRDTLNAPSKGTLAGASKTETNVTFELPKGKDANDNDVYWVCGKVLRYLTDASKPADCDTLKVETLILPLTDDNLNQFTLVETRRGQFEAVEEDSGDSDTSDDVAETDTENDENANSDSDDNANAENAENANSEDDNVAENSDENNADTSDDTAENATESEATKTLPALEFHPDINHHYTDAASFNASLEKKLTEEGYRVSAIMVKGSFENGVFTANGPVKIMVLAPQPLLDNMTEGWVANKAVTDVAKSGTPLAAIIGGTLAGTAAVALAAGIAYLLYERFKAKPKQLAIEWKGDNNSALKKIESKSPLATDGPRVLSNSVNVNDTDSVGKFAKNTTIPNTGLPEDVTVRNVDGSQMIFDTKTNKKLGVLNGSSFTATPPFEEELRTKLNLNNAERDIKKAGSSIGLSTKDFSSDDYAETTKAFLSQLANGEFNNNDYTDGITPDKFTEFAKPLSPENEKRFNLAAKEATKQIVPVTLNTQLLELSKLPANERQKAVARWRLDETKYKMSSDEFDVVFKLAKDGGNLDEAEFRKQAFDKLNLDKPQIPVKPKKGGKL